MISSQSSVAKSSVDPWSANFAERLFTPQIAQVPSKRTEAFIMQAIENPFEKDRALAIARVPYTSWNEIDRGLAGAAPLPLTTALADGTAERACYYCTLRRTVSKVKKGCLERTIFTVVLSALPRFRTSSI